MSLRIHQLKQRYRYLLAAFLLPGLSAGIGLVTSQGYEDQIARGFTPGAPLGSEPGSVMYLLERIALTLGAGLIGMTLGGVLLCLVLAVVRRMSLREALGVVFLSKYPRDWLKN